MENFNRDKFAKELNDARDLGEKGKKLAQGLKAEVNKTEEYKKAKELHIQENKDERDLNSQKNIKDRAEAVRGEIDDLRKVELEKQKALKKESLERALDKTQEQIEAELGIKFGPISGPVKFDDIGWKNENIKEGEGWRLLTAKEADAIVYPASELSDSKLFSKGEIKVIVSAYYQRLGFDLNKYFAYGIYPDDGTVLNGNAISTHESYFGFCPVSWRDNIFERVVKDAK
jgi:hypothetical protein